MEQSRRMRNKITQQEPSNSLVLRVISVVCLGFGLLIFLISFGSTYWARTNLHLVQKDEHIGLWRYCTNTDGAGRTECDDFVDRGNYGDWLKATQSFMTLGLFALLGAIGVFSVHVFVSDFQEDMRMFACSMAAGCVAGLFFMIGVTSFAVEYTTYFVTRDHYYAEDCRLGWSWYLALVSTISTFAAPTLLLIDMILRNGSSV